MVLTGIQPPENMRQTASSPRGISKSIPIPLGGRAVTTSSHCAIVGPYTTHPQLQNSAFSLSGLHNNIVSPQRSAGSFNMVHPMRKAFVLSQLMGNQTPTNSSTKIHHDETDVLLLCSSNSSPADVGGTPSSSVSSSSSSSSIFSSFVHAGNSWADQPLPTYQALISHSTHHLESCGLSMQPRELVLSSLASMSASGSNITRIASAESKSTTSSDWLSADLTRFSQLTPDLQLIGKQPVNKTTIDPQREKIPGSSCNITSSPHVLQKDETPFLDNERGICSEEEYDSLACCLQGDFWAHPEGVLCDCETLFKLQEDHSMQIDDMIFDIPRLSAPSSATDVQSPGPEAEDQAAKCHSDCMTLSNFCSSLDLITRDEVEGPLLGTKAPRSFRADGDSHDDPSASSTVIQADDQLFNQVNRGLMQGLEHTKSPPYLSDGPSTRSSECNIHGGRPSLVRSCSLTIMSPTNSFKKVEQSCYSILSRASGLGSNNMGLVQSRKRSFSASKLSSEYDGHQPDLELLVEHGNIRPHELQADQMQQPAAQKDIKLGGTDDEIMHGQCMLAEKEDNLVCWMNENDILHYNHLLMRKKGIKSNIVCGIKHNQTTHKPVGSNKSNHFQQMKALKQGRRRHGTATDQQSIAARTRREKFSERIRMLQSLVPNGERLDTVSMLGQTLEYIRFLQHQVWELYHGSPPPTNTCEKWKHFKETQDHHSSGYASSATSS